MNNTLLEVKDLIVKYGKNTAVENASFNLTKGDYLGIVGDNGSGKTSLLNAILGLNQHTEGEINFSKEAKLGYLPQKSIKVDKIFPAKVNEIVATGLLQEKKFFRFYNEVDRTKVNDILKKLNIEDLKYKKIGELSGGQQQRVFLARAMVSSPNILILDEPTNYLDAKTKSELYEMLRILNKEDEVTIMVVSHDLNTIGKYINKVLYLETNQLYFGGYEEFIKSNAMGKYFHSHNHDEDGGV